MLIQQTDKTVTIHIEDWLPTPLTPPPGLSLDPLLPKFSDYFVSSGDAAMKIRHGLLPDLAAASEAASAARKAVLALEPAASTNERGKRLGEHERHLREATDAARRLLAHVEQIRGNAVHAECQWYDGLLHVTPKNPKSIMKRRRTS